MFSSPFRGFSPDPTIEGVYGMIVAQARSPSFYRDYGVPDTVDGRFDMIVLHLVLVLRRLRQSQSQAQAQAQAQAQIRANVPALGQQIFDLFCRDMDHNFREMGIGDLAVPKEMKRVVEAFYGRTAVYEAALAADDRPALEAAVARNVFGMEEARLGARRLAAYMSEAARRLAAQHPAAGKIEFPNPAGMPENTEGQTL
jgi:cytochrome b pre-mRNA-processing protein 3